MHARIFKSFLLGHDEYLYHFRYMDSEQPDEEFESIPKLEMRLEEIVMNPSGLTEENGLAISFSVPSDIPEITWPSPLEEREPLRVAELDLDERDMLWRFVRLLAQKKGAMFHASYSA